MIRPLILNSNLLESAVSDIATFEIIVYFAEQCTIVHDFARTTTHLVK